MNRAEWEAPLHVYLDETEANPPPAWVDTEDSRRDRYQREGFQAASKSLPAAVRFAHAEGYAEGVADTVGAMRCAAFRAQAYKTDLWTALGL